MLKKLFAKLRDKIAPSRTSKAASPEAAASPSSRSHHPSERDRSHGHSQGHSPRREGGGGGGAGRVAGAAELNPANIGVNAARTREGVAPAVTAAVATGVMVMRSRSGPARTTRLSIRAANR
jgi:hypothetical protein